MRRWVARSARTGRTDASGGNERVGLVVELAGGDQREDVRRGLGVVVRAEEEPGLSADRDRRPEGALGGVVLEAEPAVVEETAKSVALADDVAEGGGDRTSYVAHGGPDGLGPDEEVVEHRSRHAGSTRVALLRGEVGSTFLEFEEHPDPEQRLAGAWILQGDRRLPELPPGVCPTTRRRREACRRRRRGRRRGRARRRRGGLDVALGTTSVLTLRARVRRATGHTHHRRVGTSGPLLQVAEVVRIVADGGAYLLLRFAGDGSPLTDTWHPTEEEAKRQALVEYEIGFSDWEPETD